MTIVKTIFIALAISALSALQVFAEEAPPVNPDAFITINGEAVLKTDFYNRLENVPVETKFGPVPAGTKAAEDIINEILVLQYAKKHGVTATESQIQSKLDFFKNQSGGNMDAFLMQTGMTLEELKEKLLVQQSFVNVVTKNVTITDAEVKQSYDKALKAPRSPYKTPDQIELSMIVVADLAKAKKAYQKLQKGTDFDKVALEFSEDPDVKENKGDLGVVNEGTPALPEDIFATAMKLQQGKMTNTVKGSDKKWYIVKAGNKLLGKVTPFAEVKDLLKEQLALEKAGGDTKAMQEFQQFVKDAKITAASPKYQSLADSIKDQAGAGLEKVPEHAGN